MSRTPVDIKGNRYGRLVALERTTRQSGNQSYYWKCICDCGTEVEVAVTHLKLGRTNSCGCYQRDIFRINRSPNGRPRVNTDDDNYWNSRHGHIRRKYGLSPEEYHQMIFDHNNRCSICGYEFGQRKGDIHIDHDHITGNVRGLLCNSCNSGLGHFKDSIYNLENAIKYLNNRAR